MKNTRIPYTVYRILQKTRHAFSAVRYALCAMRSVSRGFTLLETMIAVTLLAVAIVAPMTLTSQSLASAYYARDQITAFYLAQEALEGVRNVRDNNILYNSQVASGSAVNLLSGLPSFSGQTFTIDVRQNPPTMTLCSTYGLPGGVCTPLTTDDTLYGYGLAKTTIYTRSLTACYVQSGGACNGTVSDEVKITATVSWRTGSIQARTVSLSENLYRWVNDGSAAN
jgi:prepilin-type N-terminal cleavage/methylation domain-containing protein